jgi:hypothetical protein
MSSLLGRSIYVICTPTKYLKNITPKEEYTKINIYVSHFYIFGSVAWAHISDEKRKSLHPKNEKFIFVGYSKYFKFYQLLKPHSNEIIFRIDVKFLSSSAYEPSSSFFHFFVPILVSSSLDDDSEDENPPLLNNLPLYESIEHELAPKPMLHRCVHSTQESTGDLVVDPSNQRQTCS